MSKKAVLLVNLGSPDSTSIPDIKKYLAEFLMDKYVIDTPWLLRAFIVYGPILMFRPKKTAAAYKRIWTREGSPLVEISKATKTALQEQNETPIYLAMRYGNPSIKDVLSTIKKDNIKSVYVIPLYPQYAMSTTLTVQKEIEKHADTLEITYKEAFYKDPSYIQALVNSAKEKVSDSDYLLFSYHGLPERHLKKTDPTKSHCLSPDCCSKPSEAWNTCYKYQCIKSTELFMKKLNKNIPYSVAFQSRLGNDPWLSPNTEDELIRLAKSGIKNIKVICPSFVSDCLETLEEINMEGRETFLDNGGENFDYIPCLNTNKDWIETLSTWIR